MLLFKRTKDLEAYLLQARAQYRSVGFVPTMGALHEGHLHLIRTSQAANQLTICSIFVNPTQFNTVSDLEKYPRTPAKDLELLAKVGCDIVFLPADADIYPTDLPTASVPDLGGLDTLMEGAFRPGHFAGVAQVVSRFLDIVQPDRLYLGQKDYQQYRIIDRMVEQTRRSVKTVLVPTVREADGLALSSRNVRLSEAQRTAAPLLYQTLQTAHEQLQRRVPIAQIEGQALRTLARAAGFRPEYFQLVDAVSLQPVSDAKQAKTLVACTAVWVGEVRLIDNMVVQGHI